MPTIPALFGLNSGTFVQNGYSYFLDSFNDLDHGFIPYPNHAPGAAIDCPADGLLYDRSQGATGGGRAPDWPGNVTFSFTPATFPTTDSRVTGTISYPDGEDWYGATVAVPFRIDYAGVADAFQLVRVGGVHAVVEKVERDELSYTFTLLANLSNLSGGAMAIANFIADFAGSTETFAAVLDPSLSEGANTWYRGSITKSYEADGNAAWYPVRFRAVSTYGQSSQWVRALLPPRAVIQSDDGSAPDYLFSLADVMDADGTPNALETAGWMVYWFPDPTMPDVPEYLPVDDTGNIFGAGNPFEFDFADFAAAHLGVPVTIWAVLKDNDRMGCIATVVFVPEDAECDALVTRAGPILTACPVDGNVQIYYSAGGTADREARALVPGVRTPSLSQDGSGRVRMMVRAGDDWAMYESADEGETMVAV